MVSEVGELTRRAEIAEAEVKRLRAIITRMESVWIDWLETGSQDDAMETLIAMGDSLEGGCWDR